MKNRLRKSKWITGTVLVCMILALLGMFTGCSRTMGEDTATENTGTSGAESSGVDINMLIGTWKRVSTEVEGDVNDGGNCTITITGTSRDDLKISYNDKDFPETAFSDKPVTVIDRDPEGDLPGGSWYAVVDYVGVFDTYYDFTVLENGQLQLCNSFKVDGAPAVAFELFEKEGK